MKNNPLPADAVIIPADARGTFHQLPAADKTTSGGYATKMTSARRP